MLGALGVLDAGAIGAVWGLLAELIKGSQERALAKEERKAARAGIDSDRIAKLTSNFRDSWHSNWCLLLLASTFSFILITFSRIPGEELVSFYPGGENNSISLPILGTIYEWTGTQTYTVTCGGVVYDMLRAIVALLFRIFTGIAMRRR